MTKYEALKKMVKGRWIENEMMAKHAWYQIRGPADLLVYPQQVEDLQTVVKFCVENKIAFFVFANGTNLLISDEGIRGVVLNLKEFAGFIQSDRTRVTIGASTTVEQMTTYCEDRNLGGIDFMSGIPGTIGGALRMNAGAFTGEIADKLLDIQAVRKEDGKKVTLSKTDIGFGYRKATGMEKYIALSCRIELQEEPRETIVDRRIDILKRRAEKQPLEYPSCGSVFKRPPGTYAGKLIEEAGMKGFRIGNAQIPLKHANFILNLGGATARDVFSIIQETKRRVKEKSGIDLECEVELVGNFN